MPHAFTGAVRLLFAAVAGFFLLAMMPAICRAADADVFRVGIAAPTVNMLPLWMAQRSGLFNAHGLNVAIVNTEGGSRGLAQVGAGTLQAMVVGLSAVIDANGKGGNYRLIASGANTMSFRFFGAKGIDASEALKGRKVGVSTFGSESDSAATMALNRLGLTRNDVEMVEAGDTPTRLAALRTGQIAATALNEPADTEARDSGFPLLVDLKADLPWIFTAIAVDRDYMAAHRNKLRAFLEAYLEGVHLALSDSPRAKAVLAAEFSSFSAEALDSAYVDFRSRVPRDAEPSKEGIELMLRELTSGGRPTRITDFVDTSVLEELRARGFIEDTMRRFRPQ